MSDSTFNIDDTSIREGFSTESGYSFGEECDLEHDQWLQNYLTTIDKIVLLGKPPVKGLADPVINECFEWREKFKQKFTESERGSIFLKYSNQTDNSWSNVESRSATSKTSIDSFKWDPSRRNSRFSKQDFSLSNSTTSKSSSGTSLITLSSHGSVSEEAGGGPRSSRSIILEPLQSTTKSVTSTTSKNCDDDNNSSTRRSSKPIQLPPINVKSNKTSKKLTPDNFNKQSTIIKGFPSPPVFFSINDIFTNKPNTADYGPSLSKSGPAFNQQNQLEFGKSKGFFKNYHKAEKYKTNGSSS